MSRRSSLPGAAELFRSTGAPDRETDRAPEPVAVPELPPEPVAAGYEPEPASTASRPVRRRPRATGERRPSGRERHDEKITVYVSAEELMDLEHARLGLRGDHGLAVDRGRIVREALAYVIADLETKGESSILVRRLRGL